MMLCMLSQSRITYSSQKLKTALAHHIQKRTGQVLPDGELEASANALLSFFRLLAEADQKVMKNERDKRSPDHTHKA